MSRCQPAVLGLLLLSAGALPAAEPPAELLAEAAALRDSALAEADAWRHARSLTTEVGPRPAGSAGDRAAVAWALANLADLGFDEIRPQPVVVPAWVRGQAEARITQPFPQQLAVVALGMTIGTAEEGIEAPVVRFESLAALEAATPEDVRGHIVFIDERMERARDGSGYSAAVTKRRNGPSVAAERGAVAVVIRSVGTSDNRLPHTGGTRFTEGVRPIPAFALAGPDADMLARQVDSGRGVQMVVSSTARSLPPARSANVIAEIRGATRPEEIVILAAHLDSWDLGTGAIDNASGVAILMEAASLIARMQRRPARTIRLVLYANEEAGLDGSKTYTAAALESDEHHVVGIEADAGAGLIFELNSGVGEAALPVVEAMRGVLEPLGIAGGDNDSTGGADLSTLRAAGMPVLSLQHDMSSYFDWHHTANDTLDKIDPEALKQAVAAYAAVIWIAANIEGDFGAFPAVPPPPADPGDSSD
ncbi:MAG TPA: M20/M25/M40 family metallo-hydrolase [Gammaproteobacteria bacterium]|nr:M20/M25/M40 family metallo-hydrolase [Gammaproteobacteria bacterium]